MAYDLFSRIVLDIQIWVFFDPSLEWRQNMGFEMDYDIITLENWSQKWITEKQ